MNTDKTLTIEGVPADAGAVGDLKDIVDTLNEGGLVLKDEVISANVETWLDDHPEATTTVQDESLTYKKLVIGTLGYVTPEMFGAKGDGVTVDNAALNDCFAFCVENNIPCYGMGKTYLVDNSTGSLCNHFGLVVPGGIMIRNCHFKLKSGCPDFTTILACKYNNNNPYVIENCTFEGELRTITSGTEDGGNHGVIFCDGVDMFPSDWQSFADITIRNCDFINIQSYGIFPTPINNKLVVENCNLNCHACGILAYATDSIIRDCSYTYLSGSNTTVRTLVIDEIENFSSVSAIKKNIKIADCVSSNKIYHIQHYPQRGVVYGSIRIEKCHSGSVLLATYYENTATFDINIDSISILNCVSDGSGDTALQIRSVTCANIVFDNLTITSNNMRLTVKGAVTFINCLMNYQINVFSAAFTTLQFVNCLFTSTKSDGFITTRWGSIATCEAIYIKNSVTKSASMLLFNLDVDNIYVNGLSGDGVQIRLFIGSPATDTNIYVDGLIMPVANSQYNYFIEGITGKAVIRGMSAGINTLSVGTLVKEVTAIT